MKIKGTFYAKNQNGEIVGKGQNVIVQNGLNIFSNWLSYNNYTNYNCSKYNGLQLSTQHFVSPSDLITSDSDNLSFFNIKENFQEQNKYLTFNNGDKIYIQTTQQKGFIELSGLFLHTYSNVATSYQNNYYNFHIYIYTSNYNYSYAEQNKLWILQKIALNVSNSEELSQQKIIRFETTDSVNRTIQNVKSIKIVIKQIYGQNYADFYIRSIGILEKNKYANTPCSIALGTSNIDATINDKQLNNPYCKLFVNTQKTNLIYQQIETTVGTQTTENPKYKKAIDVQKILDIDQQLDTTIYQAKGFQIIYKSRIGYSQCNDIEFKQIGLFYPKEKADYFIGVSTCEQLFSHGVFETPWSKTSDTLIDIYYIITILI